MRDLIDVFTFYIRLVCVVLFYTQALGRNIDPGSSGKSRLVYAYIVQSMQSSSTQYVGHITNIDWSFQHFETKVWTIDSIFRSTGMGLRTFSPKLKHYDSILRLQGWKQNWFLDHLQACPFESFQCNDGLCIDGSWVCDSDNDCSDGTDEINCTNSAMVCLDLMSLIGQCT